MTILSKTWENKRYIRKTLLWAVYLGFLPENVGLNNFMSGCQVQINASQYFHIQVCS